MSKPDSAIDVLMVDKQLCDERHRRLDETLIQVHVKLDNITKILTGNGTIGLCGKVENVENASESLRKDVDIMSVKVNSHEEMVSRWKKIDDRAINLVFQVLVVVITSYIAIKLGFK